MNENGGESKRKARLDTRRITRCSQLRVIIIYTIDLFKTITIYLNLLRSIFNMYSAETQFVRYGEQLIFLL